MPEPRTFSLPALLQLCCVILITVGIPALFLRSEAAEHFLRLKEPKPTKRLKALPASGGVRDAASGKALLQADQPDWVLVGNSMLNTRVEQHYLEEICGHPAYKLSVSGTKSAMWYLLMKLIVVDSGVKPKLVTVVFRDRDLTWPELRVNQDAAMIERMKGRDLPEWDVVMADYDAKIGLPYVRFIAGIEADLQATLPGTKLREWARGKMQKIAFDLSAFGGKRDYPERRVELNDILSMDRHRATRAKAAKSNEGHDAQNEKREALEKVVPLIFDPSLEASFLPHMIALAKANGIRLHFHCIKTNPILPPLGGEEGHTLPAYMAALKDYLTSQDCLFTDEAELAELVPAMYVDDIHIKTDAANQQAFMRMFWKQVQPVVDPALKQPALAAP
jgi:hypothetical protein